MSQLDHPGTSTGKLNLFDCFIATVVVILVALAYHRLSASHRVAPPYALEEHRVTVGALLQLPADQGWLCDVATGGLQEIDPRTGAPRAEVLGCVLEEGQPVVSLRIHAVRDGSGRVLFEGEPLLPGRELQLNTETCILEGVVRQIVLEAP